MVGYDGDVLHELLVAQLPHVLFVPVIRNLILHHTPARKIQMKTIIVSFATVIKTQIMF